jgi:hypothetical protein
VVEVLVALMERRLGMRSKKARWRFVSALSLLLCFTLTLALASPSWGIRVGAETMSCGGVSGEGGTIRAHDSIAQGPIGPRAEGGGLRAYDGFFLVLPGINVPVEGASFATTTETGSVIIRWTVASVGDIANINVYRATSENGPFERVNEGPLPAETPGSFEDTTVWPETTFWYEVRVRFLDGTEDVVAGSPVMVTTAGRLALRLGAVRPNPLRDVSSLSFDVPDHAGSVSLLIYDVAGRRVKSLIDGPWDRGRYELQWDGRDSRGNAVASGVYFIRLAVDGDSRTEKAMVLR